MESREKASNDWQYGVGDHHGILARLRVAFAFDVVLPYECLQQSEVRPKRPPLLALSKVINEKHTLADHLNANGLVAGNLRWSSGGGTSLGVVARRPTRLYAGSSYWCPQNKRVSDLVLSMRGPNRKPSRIPPEGCRVRRWRYSTTKWYWVGLVTLG